MACHPYFDQFHHMAGEDGHTAAASQRYYRRLDSCTVNCRAKCLSTASAAQRKHLRVSAAAASTLKVPGEADTASYCPQPLGE